MERGRICIKAAWKLSDASSGLAFRRVTIDQKPKISGKDDTTQLHLGALPNSQLELVRITK